MIEKYRAAAGERVLTRATASVLSLRGIMARSAVADEEVVVLLRSLPNLLGIFRILATPILVWLVLQNTSFGYYGAITLLLLMAASDIVDGPLEVLQKSHEGLPGSRATVRVGASRAWSGLG